MGGAGTRLVTRFGRVDGASSIRSSRRPARNRYAALEMSDPLAHRRTRGGRANGLLNAAPDRVAALLAFLRSL